MEDHDRALYAELLGYLEQVPPWLARLRTCSVGVAITAPYRRCYVLWHQCADRSHVGVPSDDALISSSMRVTVELWREWAGWRLRRGRGRPR